MPAIAPPALITGAARVALPYGLFSTFSLRPGGDRWELGVSFEVDTLDEADGIGEMNAGVPEIQVLTVAGGPGAGTFTLAYEALGPSAVLAIGATSAAVAAALNAFMPVPVTVTGANGGPWTVNLGNGPHSDLIAADTFDVGGVTVATTQDGIAALDAPGLPKYLDPNIPDVGTATPFTVYGHFQASPMSYTAAMAQEKATAHLLAREEARVERTLWRGDLGNSPKLEDVATVVVQAVAGSSVLGLAALENHIATTYGSLGVIHMTRGAAEALLSQELLVTSGGRLTTALGTPVAAGAGYPGTGPAGEAAADGTSWIFATPALFGYRSEVFTSSDTPYDLLDRNINNLYAVAERTYLLGFDPSGVGAALINLS